MTRKKGKNRKSRQSTRETPVQAVKYTGPIDAPSFKADTDLHTFLLPYSGTLASNGSGVLAPVLDSYSQCSSNANWVQLQAIFQEYRILAYKFVFMPVNKYNKATTTATFPILSVLERTNSSALTSLSDAAGYASSMQHSLDDTWRREIRMNGVDEAQFTATSTFPAVSSRLYIKLYCSGLAVSTTYGQYLSYTVVQFRGIL